MGKCYILTQFFLLVKKYFDKINLPTDKTQKRIEKYFTLLSEQTQNI